MFSYVEEALANGKCLGIFPEGGSHDNTDLLPLKVSSILLIIRSKLIMSICRLAWRRSRWACTRSTA